MKWLELLDVELPSLGNVTDATRNNAKKYITRFRGSVRVSLGKFETDIEYNDRRKRILNTPLP